MGHCEGIAICVVESESLKKKDKARLWLINKIDLDQNLNEDIKQD